jgi:hypothetical protein
MVTNNRSRLNFNISSEGDFKSVKKVIPVDIFLAAGIIDGEGKKSNRLVLRVKGSEQFYFLFGKGVETNMKPTANWLQELLERECPSDSNKVMNSLPEDLPGICSIGDPLED